VGTTVTLWLPALTPESAGVVAGPAGSRVDTTPAAVEPVAVLLVDDEDMVRLLLSEWLTSKGFAVTVAASAEAALALLRDGLPVDLLLTDLSMPDMDGIELIRAAQAARGNLPAILLTGNISAARVAIEGFAGSNCTVLHKPVHLDALPDRIMMALQKAS
jgi:CheY-like chemotaxis protein